MKKNQVLLLLFLAVVLAIVGVYFQMAGSAGWKGTKTDRRILRDLPVNDITKIQIRSGTTTVTLEKKQDQWEVAERNGYPADFDKIREFIRSLWQLKAVRGMEIGPSQFARLKIAAPGQNNDSGVGINLSGPNDRPIAAMVLGKMMEQGEDATRGVAGRFVYNPAAKDRVSLVGETFANVDPINVGSWLNKLFIVPGDLQEVEQSSWSNNQGWKIVRDNPKGDWKLPDAQSGETLDKQFAQAAGNFAPSFVDVRPASVSTDETGFNQPFRVRLKNFEGFKYNLTIGKAGPDKTRYLKFEVDAELNPTRTPGPNESSEDKKKKDQEFEKKAGDLRRRLEDEKKLQAWVYLVPDWSLDQLLKRRDEILAKPSPSPSPAPNALPSVNPLPVPVPSAAPVAPSPIASPTPG